MALATSNHLEKVVSLVWGEVVFDALTIRTSLAHLIVGLAVEGFALLGLFDLFEEMSDLFVFH